LAREHVSAAEPGPLIVAHEFDSCLSEDLADSILIMHSNVGKTRPLLDHHLFAGHATVLIVWSFDGNHLRIVQIL
jgi:hypothetical protein